MRFCSTRTWFHLLSTFVVRSGADCLESAVPEIERSYIKDVRGEDVEIDLVASDWPASEFATALAKVLIQEALGYKAKINPIRAFSGLDAVLALTGCDDMVCSSPSQDRSDVALEIWLGAYGGDYDAFGLRHPDKLPEDIGSIGYEGEEAMFVSSKLTEEAYEESGQSLNWYRSYNASWPLVRKYFASLSDLPLEDFAFCNDSSKIWTELPFMNDYARWSGDTEGLIEVPGGYTAKCDGGGGRFWISPACRHNVSQCIPILAQEYGWLVDAYMAWSTAYAIPAAVGILGRTYESTEARYEYFYSLAATFSVLSYGYRPYVSQDGFNPNQVVFPAHSASEWAVGNKRTAGVGTYVGKLVSRSLRGRATRVVTFLTNIKIDLVEMEDFLGRKDETKSWEDVACEWIISNGDRWDKWIPKENTCFPGFGLVDGAGAKVTSRDAAVGCALCLPGTLSLPVLDNIGRTYVCKSCEVGTFQELSGQSLCPSCPAGRIASQPGSSSCDACKPGTYNNMSGMEGCEMCGTGSPQWTTSRMTDIRGTTTWIQVEAADSVDLCHCIEGWFLGHDGECHECTEGALCPGSGEVEVLPGYFSFSEDPGSIYRCHGNALRCPGGLPGTCADGRESTSMTCSACLPGLHASEAGCIPCESQDYVIVTFVALATVAATGGFHSFLLASSSGGQVVADGLVKAGIYVGQLAVCVQVTVVIRNLQIEWQDPFLLILSAFNFISLQDLVESLGAIACVTRLTPTWKFLVQTTAVPLAFMVGPVVVHLVFVRRARTRAQLKLHVLGETLGFFCMLFFILLCSAVLAPFDCVSHPNGASTMRSATDVLCNLKDDHLSLSFAAALLTLLPIAFVSICTYIVFIELPKRIRQMDVRFIRSCSFLFFRFRPGTEGFSIFLLIRNVIVAMAPVLPSTAGACFVILCVLCGNLCLSAMLKPWLFAFATYADLLANFCFLLILFQGAFFVENLQGQSGMILCAIMLCGILLLFLGLSTFALAKHLLRKQATEYDFFLTHHKGTCGSIARLIKVELQQRRFSVFLDTDDLSSLTHLFAILSQNVRTLLVIASPNILTRKWCVGEITTANIQKVDTFVIALPGFHFPDNAFMEAFDAVVDGLSDLANYGLGKSEVREALKALSARKSLQWPAFFRPSDVDEILQQVTPSTRKLKEPPRFSSTDGRRRSESTSGSSCLILANHKDLEALATAHVLRIWMFPCLIHKRIDGPFVLSPNEYVMEIGSEESKFVILLCSKDCLEVPFMVSWIIQCYHFSSYCHLLPVLADEVFQVPGAAIDFNALAQSQSNVSKEDMDNYLWVIRAAFTQIASSFYICYSGENTVKAKAVQIAERLTTDVELLPSLLSVKRNPSYVFEEAINQVRAQAEQMGHEGTPNRQESDSHLAFNEEMVEKAF